MQIDILNTFEELSQKAGDIIIREIQNNKKLLLCTATGETPTRTYELLGKEYEIQPGLFDQLRVIKLDEWGGISMDNPATCESYLQTHLINALQIPVSRYIGFNSNPSNPKQECSRIMEKLNREGPIDLCILGLGMNGHLALNEPAGFLQPHCHVSKLSAQSLEHSMISEIQIKPKYGLTLGMADIMLSKMIILMINGVKKKDIVSRLFSKKITSSLPASFLWLHPNVICLVEKDSLS